MKKARKVCPIFGSHSFKRKDDNSNDKHFTCYTKCKISFGKSNQMQNTYQDWHCDCDQGKQWNVQSFLPHDNRIILEIA